ncbi:ATP-dependent Clp protease ATP-binding subunit [Micromonospora sp. KC207]|uniref:Clp protease N-terminal domain-containing protein n=1 Tax=Micromonospora sp. KC207 TaxID=2530377 RepID=UPI0010518E44|nr:Clp protease N-terminal domain-containing protein [Micromonospora sp. KC207]TDC52819.1 ATP-dependent Clp protease ATP-binding subunit [Micromonospora sp. KC207]
MPKINVYLPDELAEAVKETGVPVSAICQRALEQAVRRVTAVRQTALGQLTRDDLDERFPHFTGRARAVLALAIERAGTASAPSVGTGHLLAGIVGEGSNLALHVLRAIEIDQAHVLRDLQRHPGVEPGGASEDGSVHFSTAAAGALELAVTEATSLGHNYIGCEHLLLGLVAEPDGVAGQVLRSLGADPRLTRRAVAAALAGYVHLRAQTPPQPSAEPVQALAAAMQQHLQPLIARIERLEQQLSLPDPSR